MKWWIAVSTRPAQNSVLYVCCSGFIVWSVRFSVPSLSTISTQMNIYAIHAIKYAGRKRDILHFESGSPSPTPQQSSNPLTTRNAAWKPDTIESTGARVTSHGLSSWMCFVFAIFGRFPSAMLNECYHTRNWFKINSWINLSYHDYIRAANVRHFICIELSSVGAKQKCEWSSCDCLQRFGPLRVASCDKRIIESWASIDWFDILLCSTLLYTARQYCDVQISPKFLYKYAYSSERQAPAQLRINTSIRRKMHRWKKK